MLSTGSDRRRLASNLNPEFADGAQDLSRLRFEAYDADFNRSLAAASTIGNLDEVPPLSHAVHSVIQLSFALCSCSAQHLADGASVGWALGIITDTCVLPVLPLPVSVASC